MDAEEQVAALQAQVAQLQFQNVQLQNAVNQPAPAQPVAVPPPAQPQRQQPKPVRPDKWDGKGNLLKKFGVPMRRYLRHFQMHECEEGIEYALDYLPASYVQMWEQHRDAGIDVPTTFRGFYALLRGWYPQADQQQQAMADMDALTARKWRIVDYNEAWSWLIMELGDSVTPQTIKHRYLRGLTVEMQRDLASMVDFANDGIARLMTLAVQSEARQRQMRQSTGAVFRQSAPAQQRAGDLQTAADDPMDVNAGRAVPFAGKCYKCKKKGHKAQDCPGPRDRQQHGADARPAGQRQPKK